MERTKALGGVVIVNNPQNGDILALASRPSFDNRNFQAFPPESWKNLATNMVFEPGSTVKPLVMAAALEEEKLFSRINSFVLVSLWYIIIECEILRLMVKKNWKIY